MSGRNSTRVEADSSVGPEERSQRLARSRDRGIDCKYLKDDEAGGERALRSNVSFSAGSTNESILVVRLEDV